MKNTITVDADVIIEYLKTGEGKLTDAYEKYSMIIAPVTYSEILASQTFTEESLEQDVVSFLKEYFKIHETNEVIAHNAAKIIREHNNITMAHAFVAAMAIENKTPLLTMRPEIYDGIDGLEMVEV